MKKLPTQYPSLDLRVARDKVEIPDIYLVLRDIIDAFRKFRVTTSSVINFNCVEFVSQASAPTLENGELVLWKDSDATSGNPTHYLVMKDSNGDQVTFASEETVA